jgi:hypothetical protein
MVTSEKKIRSKYGDFFSFLYLKTTFVYNSHGNIFWVATVQNFASKKKHWLK